MRSELGWYAANTLGAATWDKLGLQKLNDLESNTFFGGKFTAGGDVRFQLTRIGAPLPSPVAGGPVELPDRIFFPMQISPGGSLNLHKTLTIAGNVNLAGFAYRYPGQALYDAYIKWMPDQSLPYIRAGMIQPSFGLRHDDHTMLIRANPAGSSRPLLAPFWGDLGAEIGYEGLHLLNLEAAVFMPRNLANSVQSITTDYIGKNDVGVSGRAVLWPRLEEEGINFALGVSAMKAGEFAMEDVFAGVGKTYWGTLMAEGSHSTAGNRDTTAASFIADWTPREWFVVEGRAERAIVHDTNRRVQRDQYVAGLQFFPVPYLELRPEYRYVTNADTAPFGLTDWTMGQYTLQVHAFF